jgi:hypothetical protein
MSNYKSLSNFGNNTLDPKDNPLTYCLFENMDNAFNHGSISQRVSSPYGRPCQAFMAQYCANGWDDICELASKNKSYKPNLLQRCATGSQVACQGLTVGEILIANTAARKYLVSMGGNCTLRYEQFDPLNPASPLVSYFEGGCCNLQGSNLCIPVYQVDPTKIDNDPVMNKILAKPIIAWSILVNIYNTANRLNKLQELKGTKIFNFFMSKPFQNYINYQNKNSWPNNYRGKFCF